MATLVLDTHKAINRLREAGFDDAKAEAIIESFQEVGADNLVTKQDLRVAMSELKADLLKWLIPILLGQIVVFAAVVSFLIGKT